MKKNTPLFTIIIAIVFAGFSLFFLFKTFSAVHTLDNKTLNTDTSLIVADGDFISIDFVGTVDGKEIRGGNTKGTGEDLLIGSGSYIDNFEDQLIGHHVGETLDVIVTYPEDYVDEDLRNKEAVYTTTINGIYQ